MSLPIIHGMPLTASQQAALAYVKRNGPVPRLVWAQAGIASHTMALLVQRGFVEYLRDTREYRCTAAGESAQ